MQSITLLYLALKSEKEEKYRKIVCRKDMRKERVPTKSTCWIEMNYLFQIEVLNSSGNPEEHKNIDSVGWIVVKVTFVECTLDHVRTCLSRRYFWRIGYG